MVIAAVAEQAEPDYLDADIVDEDSGALPVGAGMKADVGGAEQPSLFDEVANRTRRRSRTKNPAAPEVDAAENVDEELADDEYEYVDDTSGLEAEEEPRATVSTVRIVPAGWNRAQPPRCQLASTGSGDVR